MWGEAKKLLEVFLSCLHSFFRCLPGACVHMVCAGRRVRYQNENTLFFLSVRYHFRASFVGFLWWSRPPHNLALKPLKTKVLLFFTEISRVFIFCYNQGFGISHFACKLRNENVLILTLSGHHCEIKKSLSWPYPDTSPALSWPYHHLIRNSFKAYLDLILTLSGLSPIPKPNLILTLSCSYLELKLILILKILSIEFQVCWFCSNSSPS